MSSWDTVNRWRATSNGLMNEFIVLLDDTRQLGFRTEAQGVKLKTTAQEVIKRRGVLVKDAYVVLNTFVDELLKYTNGEEDIGSSGVPSLPGVVGCFGDLVQFCEWVIEAEGLEAVEATQEIGEDEQVNQRINGLRKRVQSDIDGLHQAVSEAEKVFVTNHEHHISAYKALCKAENRRNELFYSMFGNSDIDSAVENCQENERFWRESAEEAHNVGIQLVNLKATLSLLHDNDLGQLSSHLSSSADQMRANYTEIGEQRKIDMECWMAARVLQYHVTANSRYTSRDDALRHVIKLIDTFNKTTDSESGVESLKAFMEHKIRRDLGGKKAAELHKERVYLVKPEDVDF